MFKQFRDADWLTKFAGIGDVVVGFIGDSYTFAQFIDIIGNLEPSFLGMLSYPALGVGVSGAVLTALGSAYVHTYVNMQNQNVDHIYQFNTHQSQLGYGQWGALLGDFLSNIGYKAGTITLTVNSFTQNSMPRWSKGVLLGGTCLFGALTSIAFFRTGKNAMLQHNSKNVELADEVTPTTPLL